MFDIQITNIGTSLLPSYRLQINGVNVARAGRYAEDLLPLYGEISDNDDKAEALLKATLRTRIPYCNAISPSGLSSCYLDKGHDLDVLPHYAPCPEHGDVNCGHEEIWV